MLLAHYLLHLQHQAASEVVDMADFDSNGAVICVHHGHEGVTLH